MATPEITEELTGLYAALKRETADPLRGDVESRHIALTLSNGERVELPRQVEQLLIEMVAALARGETVAFVPTQRELTTRESAEFLNMSRQHFVRLVEAGALPFHLVGTHRRVYFNDLLEYKQRRDTSRQANLERIQSLSQEIGQYDIGGEPMPKTRQGSNRQDTR